MKKFDFLKMFTIACLLATSANLWASKVSVLTFTTGALESAVTAAAGGQLTADTLAITGTTQFDATDYTYLKNLTVVIDLSGYTFTNNVMPASAFSTAKMTGIILPSNLMKISNSAFEKCISLSYVAIPESVDSLGTMAFLDCSVLQHVEISDSVEFLGTQVFRNCFNLKVANIPSKVKSLDATFQACRALPSMVVPASVTTIANATFNDCAAVKAFYMQSTTPPALAHINAFRYCKATIYVPKGSLAAYKAATIWKDLTLQFKEADVIAIRQFETGKLKEAVNALTSSPFDLLYVSGKTSFDKSIKPNIVSKDHTYLQTLTSAIDLSQYIFEKNEMTEEMLRIGKMSALTLPATLKTIGKFAVYDCDSLKTITIPASIDSIGQAAFEGCLNLQRVNFESTTNLRSVMNTAFAKCAIDSITLPNSITLLGGNLFQECNKLASVNIPTGVARLVGTFQSCTALTSVIVPASVNEISFQTFFNCTALKKIYVENPTPPIVPAAIVFGGTTPSTLIVYVNDAAAKTAYLAAKIWEDMDIRAKSEETGIEKLKVDSSIRIYPNPVVEQLNIIADSAIREVCISDLSGRIIERVYGVGTVNASQWANGVYLVKIVTDKGSNVDKIIKK